MKKFAYYFVVSALVLAGCEKDPKTSDDPEPVKVESVSVAPVSLELEVGDSDTLVATVLPADAANKAVSWSSSAPAVASVSSSGLVTGLAEGSATITATTEEGAKTASCTVSVLPEDEPEPEPSPIEDGYFAIEDATYSEDEFPVATGETRFSDVDVVAAEGGGESVVTIVSPEPLDKIYAGVEGTEGYLELDAVPVSTPETRAGETYTYTFTLVLSDELADGFTLLISARLTDSGEIVVAFTLELSAEGEPQQELNVLDFIPDPVFHRYCVESMTMGSWYNNFIGGSGIVPAWDTNGDGILSTTEAAAVSGLYLSGSQEAQYPNIASFEGIEYFTGLKVLTLLGFSSLTSLDVSGCTELVYFDCSNNHLTSLDVSGCTELVFLECSGNQLSSLDVSNNTKLETLSCFHYWAGLSSLDISNNTKLVRLSISGNQLTSLDVSKNTALTNLYCNSNQITSLDLSKNTALTNLQCDNNRLTSLDVSKNAALKTLLCAYNQLSSLDLYNNVELTQLWCSFNILTSLDVSKNTKLTNLECHNNRLTSLDVSKNTVLMQLLCPNNLLTSLDITNNTEMSSLDCKGNPGDGERFNVYVVWTNETFYNSLWNLWQWDYEGTTIEIWITIVT